MIIPELHIQNKIHFGGLSVFPLVTKKQLKLEVNSGMEMLEKGIVRIEEVDQSGTVSTLLMSNSGKFHVLFLEGDQLIGAKQNRICNSTVLMPPQSHAKIPVSCVERERKELTSTRRATRGEGV